MFSNRESAREDSPVVAEPGISLQALASPLEESVEAFAPAGTRFYRQTPFARHRKTAVSSFFAVLFCVLFYYFGSLFLSSLFTTKKSLLCASIALCATLFWSFHILPLDVSSALLLPVLVFSGVLTDQEIFSGIFFSFREIGKIFISNITLLLLGSCLLSVYFKNSGGEALVLPYLLGGGSPPFALFRAMSLSLVLSSVMSNVTAPIVIVSILQSSSAPPSQAVVLGVALASNIGGMLLPISSPQSILGSSRMQVGWSEWVFFSAPVVASSFLLVFSLLLFFFPVPEPEPPLKPASFRCNSVSLAFTTLFCVFCWAASSALPSYGKLFCSAPVVFLLCTRGSLAVINRKNFEIISIAISGSALGRAIEQTKMLEQLVSSVLVLNRSSAILLTVLCSSLLMIAASSLVCHAVSAVVLLPVFQQLGAAIGREKLLLGAVSLSCSCGMALPTSGFPNILASSVRNKRGERMVGARLFIALGTLSTLLCWVSLSTVGVYIMTVLGF